MTETMTLYHRMDAVTAEAEARARDMRDAIIGGALRTAFAAIRRTAVALYRHWRESVELRRSIAYLEGLDERLLADIGLSRITLEEALQHSAKTASPVDAVIADTAPAQNAANQDHPARRHAA